MNVTGLAAKIAVKTKGGAKALSLNLEANIVIDPTDPFYVDLTRRLPEVEALRTVSASAPLPESAGDGEDEEDDAASEGDYHEFRGHRLGAGTHTVRIWGLPAPSRTPEAAPLMELWAAAFGERLRVYTGSGAARLRIEIQQRMAQLGGYSCPDLAAIHNAEVWLDVFEHQAKLEEAQTDAVAPKKRGKKAKQEDLFTQPAALPDRSDTPSFGAAAVMWAEGPANGRVLLSEDDGVGLDDAIAARELQAAPLPDAHPPGPELRVAYGTLGGQTRWWVIGRMEFAGKEGWWAHPVGIVEPAVEEPLVEVEFFVRPGAPTEEEAQRAWRDGDVAARVVAHTNASLSLVDIARAGKWDLWGEVEDLAYPSRTLGIVWGEIAGVDGWWIVGIMEVGGEAAWWGDMTARSSDETEPVEQPGTHHVANATFHNGGLVVNEGRRADTAGYVPDDPPTNGNGERPTDPMPAEDNWKPWSAANIAQLRNAGIDDDGADALDRYLAALEGDRLVAQVKALDLKTRATSPTRLRALVREHIADASRP